MKVFVDMADQYRSLKIIALGAVGTARQVVEADIEMRNRVSEVFVPLMSEKEIAAIINKGEKLLNFALDDSVRSGIVKYSNGLASVCHQLCLNICFASDLYRTLAQQTSIEHVALQKAVEDYLEDASDTIKSAFNKALRKKKASGKFENGRLILKALTRHDQDGATHGEILVAIRKKHIDYPSGNLTHYLKYLQMEEQGALLRLDTSSGKFSFSDPISSLCCHLLRKRKL